MAQRDPNSLVVGIYGPWGDGKTSVLNMVEKTLTEDPDVIAVKFNPWQLGDETLVFRGFFELLAKTMDAKLVSGKARAGKLLTQYGALLKPIPLAGDALAIGAGAAGQTMAAGSADLAEQKRKIDKLLGKSGKRIVILMDDLDRLDKSEIQVIFRLVKVAADFKHTAYVLAFDDTVVSAALADRYAIGSIHGVNFLEKIVQLPLHLPPVGQTELLKLTFEAVDVALLQAKIGLSQQQLSAFGVTFQRSITPRLKTPRVGKRYGNAVMFALPMIGDETSPVDLLLMEAMRIFFPPMYEWVRGNRDVVLSTGGHRGGDAMSELVRSGFETATAGLSSAEVDGAKVLLNFLLPRTESAWQNKSWDYSWDGLWARPG
jgi:predicted KAP-like P-loop ATPase